MGHVLAWLNFTALLTGFAFACIGLVRALRLYHARQGMLSRFPGDIVPADDVLLKVGTPLTLHSERGNEKPVNYRGTLSKRHPESLSVELEFEPEDDAPKLRSGECVTICLMRQDAQYRLLTSVLDAAPPGGPDTPLRLILKRPEWASRTQRRRHVRIDLNLPATLTPTVKPPRNPAHEQTELVECARHAAIVNLSGSGFLADFGPGMSISEAERLCRLFGPDSSVHVRMPIPQLSSRPLTAQIRECRRVIARGGLGVMAACEFLPLASWEEDIIVRFIFRERRLAAESARSAQAS